jgi:A/G-specific adenine glycosylase
MPEPVAADSAEAASEAFAERIVRWQRQLGRHDLPWQNTHDPYRIWLSEIMLQQTQVGTVIPYYERFLARFPDIASLAAAPLDAVMQLWAGLGYYSRARNLHRAAEMMVAQHGARMPRSRAAIEQLPGIGRSTAAAIATFAFGAREAILDGNVKRVLARHRAIEGPPASSAVLAQLWAVAEAALPAPPPIDDPLIDDPLIDDPLIDDPLIDPPGASALRAYCQGLMDLGATVCTRSQPNCERCPVHADCLARLNDRVHELPTPRARRVQPVRTATLLVLLREDEVLLEQRPARGIWGGLWSLPELDPGADPSLVALHRYGFEALEIHPLPGLRHGFTHFTLDIAPLCVRCRGSVPGASEPGVQWIPIAAAGSAAVPVPVRRILDSLAAPAPQDLLAR